MKHGSEKRPDEAPFEVRAGTGHVGRDDLDRRFGERVAAELVRRSEQFCTTSRAGHRRPHHDVGVQPVLDEVERLVRQRAAQQLLTQVEPGAGSRPDGARCVHIGRRYVGGMSPPTFRWATLQRGHEHRASGSTRCHAESHDQRHSRSDVTSDPEVVIAPTVTPAGPVDRPPMRVIPRRRRGRARSRAS